MSVLVCRNCGSQNIASLDQYLGTCVGLVVTRSGEPRFEPGGYTEIHWDSCTQLGWQCTDCYTTEHVGEGDSLEEALLRLVEETPPQAAIFDASSIEADPKNAQRKGA